MNTEKNCTAEIRLSHIQMGMYPTEAAPTQLAPVAAVAGNFCHHCKEVINFYLCL